MKTENRNQTKQMFIIAIERDDGQYEVDKKILSKSELDKLCKLMPRCQLFIIYDASINGIRFKARERAQQQIKNEQGTI